MGDDIVHALTKVCRFNGHTKSFYSVAQHSILVAALVHRWGGTHVEVLQGLLHDATEAYISDLNTPAKRLIGEAYTNLEERIWYAIADRYGLPHELSPLVKKADHYMLCYEAEHLLNTPQGADKWWSVPEDFPEDFKDITNDGGSDELYHTFSELMVELILAIHGDIYA